MKKKWIILCVLGGIALFLISPRFPIVRSLSVMPIYSRYCARDSIMEEENFELEIPGGGATEKTDWYPFVMTFTADREFARYSGIDGAKLTILYNFPAFSQAHGCSRLFDGASPYYNSFYGAYLISTPDGKPFFTTKDAKSLESAAALAARFDFFELVLEDFGLTSEQEVFECTKETVSENVRFAGYDGWSRMTASLLVNGAAHEREGFVGSYMQYGSPKFPAPVPFAPVQMKCIIDARYFEEWNTTIFFYVMTPDKETAEECEREILAKAKIAPSPAKLH
ncbi:MAG: hypothetical protein RSC52_02660 [Oscillospiraceae bacterium]